MERLSTLTDYEVTRTRALDAARYVRCIAAHRNPVDAVEAFAAAWPRSPAVPALRDAADDWLHGKGAVSALSGSAAILPPGLSAALIGSAAATAILPRLGAVAVPANVSLSVLVNEPAAYWHDEAQRKPISAAGFESGRVAPRTAAAILIVTREVLQLATPATDQFLRDQLAKAVNQYVDAQLVADLTSAAGSPVAASSGTLAADLAVLLAAYVAGGGKMARATLLLSSANAAAAALTAPDLCRDLTRNGGTLAGLPALCSDSVGSALIAVDAGRVLVSDSNELAISVAEHASIEMSDAPDGQTALTSLWQTNAVGLRAERGVAWSILANAAAAVADVDYLSTGSPA